MVDDVIRERSRRGNAIHTAWALAQVAKGVDGPVPPGRPDGSDYNQHVPDLEASGADLDELAAAMAAVDAEILTGTR